MPDNSVTISVVTYNSEQHIEKLLASLFCHIKGIDFHIFVIDNGSTDRTLQILSRLDDARLTVIRSEKNLGFGRAHNQVLARISSRYQLVINPDVYVADDVVTGLAHYMDQNAQLGIVLPKVLHPDGKLQVLPKRDPKFIYLLSRRLKLPFLKKYRTAYEMAGMNMDTKFDIEFCTGAFMFMRTELFKKAGGFDDRYFMYFEDADLTREIRQYARVEYNPAFTVYHAWERAGSKQLKFFIIQVCSMFKYMRKWRRRG